MWNNKIIIINTSIFRMEFNVNHQSTEKVFPHHNSMRYNLRFAYFWLHIVCPSFDVNKTIIFTQWTGWFVVCVIQTNCRKTKNRHQFKWIYWIFSKRWCVHSNCELGELLDCLHWYGIDHVDFFFFDGPVALLRWFISQDLHYVCKCIQLFEYISILITRLLTIIIMALVFVFFHSFKNRITHFGY